MIGRKTQKSRFFQGFFEKDIDRRNIREYNIARRKKCDKSKEQKGIKTMLGNLRTGRTPLRIDPGEMVRLTTAHGTLDSVEAAVAIAKEWERQHGENETEWDVMQMMAAVFDAGRVQGIREAREREATRKQA